MDAAVIYKGSTLYWGSGSTCKYRFTVHFVCDMSDRFHWQSVLRYLLTAGAVYVLTLTSLSPAHATCGDYLHHAGSPEPAKVDTDQLTHAQPVPAQQPCSGPECQNHLPDPAPESPVIVLTASKPACAFARVELKSGAPLTAAILGQNRHYTNACRTRIDRPPRTSAV